MRRIVTLVLVATAVVATAAVARAAVSPKALRASIVSAALAQKSVHWTEHDLIGGAEVSSAADVNANAGTQQLTIRAGKDKGTIHIVFISNTAYVKGDAFGLKANLGLTPAQVKQYTGKWILIPKGDKAYAPISGGLTVPSIVHGITPHGTMKATKRKVHGRRVFVLEAVSGQGTKRVGESLLAQASGKPLPIADAVFAPAREVISRKDFSKWNETVSVKAPSDSTPIGTVRGG